MVDMPMITREDLEGLKVRMHNQDKVIAELRWQLENEVKMKMVTRDRFAEMKGIIMDMFQQMDYGVCPTEELIKRVREI
jgi:hypothetical protein